MLPGIEHGRTQRHQGHKEYVRKHIAGQARCRIKRRRFVRKTGSDHKYEDRSSNDT